MKKKIVVGLISIFGLAGCATEIEFPAALVTQSGDGPTVAYIGTLLGNIDGTSTYRLVSEDGTDVCTGTTEVGGMGGFTCTGGQVGQFTFPKEIVGKFSATNAGVTDSGIRYAFGWGKDADISSLMGLVPDAP
ncbi:MAG: hypothetical protein QNI90_03230 [Dinoroseobacter sp.]|nr:hypothetical protein [Dinoroseobacter sp.]